MEDGDKLTCQFDLWPDKVEHSFIVTNQLLKSCIGLRGEYRGEKIIGFNSGKRTVGYALLCDLAARALSFRRLPFLEDRIFADYELRNLVKAHNGLLRSLTSSELQSAASELSDLYHHTQTKLAEAGLKHVRLRRNLRINRDSENYCHTLSLMKLKEAADILSMPTVLLESDTLLSFTNSEREYAADAFFEMYIPAEKILYCSQLVTSLDNEQLVESKEWVVVNDSPTGAFEISAEGIHFEFEKYNLGLSIDSAKTFINQHTPWKIRGLADRAFNEISVGTTHTKTRRYKFILWLSSILLPNSEIR